MNIKEILKWFKKAVPDPTVETACVQIGCGYEETLERAVALDEIQELKDAINLASKCYKEKDRSYLHVLKSMDKQQSVELLDSMCDEIVTRIGEAYMLGFDIVGALDEVNRSNWSKFENGEPLFDENGKIKKGQSYFKPDLSKFV